MRNKVLLVEDDNSCHPRIIGSLSHQGYAVRLARDLARAEEDILSRRFDAVVLGINLSDGHGTGLIRRIRASSPFLPIVVLTGSDEIEIAVEAVRCGADNVLAKPVDCAALFFFLESHLEKGSLKPEPAPASAGEPKAWSEEDFFGTGPAARRFIELAAGAATGNSPVLITGETGTGKGMLARWMHQNGNRSARPFVGANCSGLRGDLLKAEIFGTCGGTRPGRGRNNPGLLEKADGGTLFLDEIGDMAPTAQAELLAVLKGQSLRPGAGGEAPDARLICSSNQQLDALAHAGSFLPDLLCCLSATVLRIRPLRERLLELPGIVRHLLDELRGPGVQISGEAMRVLSGYRWPGNLRELKNALEQGVLLSHDERLLPEHFGWLKPLSRARGLRPVRSAGESAREKLAVQSR